jgi:hypothetical protein
MVNALEAAAKQSNTPNFPQTPPTTSVLSKVIMKSTSLLPICKGASIAFALLAVSISGCTKDAAPSTTDSTVVPKEAGAKTGAKAVVALNAAPELPGVKVQPGTASDGFDGARSDVSELSCKSDGKGAWNVSGIVKNSTDKAVNYRIYTSFLRGTETLGLVETDLENVKANDTKKWSGSMTIDADKVDCVLRVERVKR